MNVKVKISLILISLLACFNVNGQKKGFAYLSGHVINPKDSLVVKFSILRNQISKMSREFIDLEAPVDKDGNFTLRIAPIEQPSRIWSISIVQYSPITKKNRDMDLASDFLISAGDNIKMGIIIPTGYAKPVVSFSGIGAAKMECQNLISSIKKDPPWDWQNDKNNFVVKTLPFIDSVLQVQIAILNRMKDKMTAKDYGILKLDIVGFSAEYGMFHLYQLKHPESYTLKECQESRQAFNRMIKKYLPSNNVLIPYSNNFLDFLMYRDEAECALANNGKNYSLKQWYTWLKSHYNGTLREYVLAHYFLNNIRRTGGTFIPAVNANDYTYSINDAATIVKNPTIKIKLKVWQRLGKGAPVYNFDLPLDSTSKRVRLTDLKGKVVLIDMWAYTCDPCFKFATVFHKLVYPHFKNNPQFAYVSIMAGHGRQDYMQRLRGLDNHNRPDTTGLFTSPEYINLFGGKGEPNGKKMEDYYHVFARPFILLVDKRGNIFSSTVPFFEEATSPNVRKLTDLIYQALAEKN